jgi:hypothetical protein
MPSAPNPDGSRNANPADQSFAALVREDFATHGGEFFSQGFWAVFWHASAIFAWRCAPSWRAHR